MAETIGIGRKGTKTIDLWCRATQKGDDIEFHVINGRWDGTLYADGRVSHARGSVPGEHVVLWRGEVPPEHGDYNAAIRWINSQLGG